MEKQCVGVAVTAPSKCAKCSLLLLSLPAHTMLQLLQQLLLHEACIRHGQAPSL